VVDALAGVLGAADARRYDGALLGAAARYPDALVRGQAALAMGRIGNRAALPDLVELMADPDTAVRQDAVFALGLLGDPAAIPALRELVVNSAASAQSVVHSEAVTALLKIGQADSTARAGVADLVRQILLRESADVEAGGVSPVVEQALLESWRLADDAPVGVLVQLAETRNLTARRRAVYSLMRLRAVAAARVMLAAIDDDDPDVRANAARTLTKRYVESAGIDPAASAERLIRRLADDEPGVRINALRSLGGYEDPRYSDAVIDRIDDAEPNVRVQALVALGQLGGMRASSVLEEATRDGSYAEREEALWGLARVDRTRGIRIAASWITSGEWQRRYAGTNALAVLGGDTAAAWLEGMLADIDPRVVAAAYGALGRVDSAWARQLARGLLEHPDVVVRSLAAGRVGASPVSGDVARLSAAYAVAINDRDSDARLAIVGAIASAAKLDVSEQIALDDFVARFPRCDDYLVRREASERLPAAAGRWGPEFPVETGMTVADYRDVVRRLVLPAVREGRQPGLVIDSDRGRIEITLFADAAPMTVNALLQLADRGYFDGGAWHRVVPNFVIQDGDPRGDGAGGPGFALRDEINVHRYNRGTVGMALSGPDTGGSQFFITHAPQPHLDGGYTVIGEVSSGMDVVDRTTQGDHIRTIRRR